MSNSSLNWIANFIWGIADDVLRDVYRWLNIIPTPPSRKNAKPEQGLKRK